MKLYQVVSEFTALIENADLTDAEVVDRLRDLQFDLGVKLANCCRLYRNISAEAEALQAEEERLRARRKSVERRAESLKNYIAWAVGEGNVWHDDVFKIGWRKSEAVVIDRPQDLLGIYIKEEIVRTPDKDAIRQAIKSGETVPGARLEQRLNLQIK